MAIEDIRRLLHDNDGLLAEMRAVHHGERKLDSGAVLALLMRASVALAATSDHLAGHGSALERGRETLRKAIADRADMQARTAKLARVVREWAVCESPEPERVIDAVVDAIDEYDRVDEKVE